MSKLNFEEHMLKNFSLMYPSTSELVVNHKYIGDFEMVFELSDGSKVRYDEYGNGIETIKHSYYEDRTELSEEEWKKEFTRKLKKKLKLKGVTQKELASAIEVSEVAISRYISGKRIPSMYTVIKIAKFFHCPIDDLTDFDYLL